MPEADSLERATIRRVTRRLMPFLFVLYIANYLDRVNVSFAALQMNHDLGFSSAAYGLGAGIFFLGYCLCQVPSNLLLARVGARRWIAALMVAWGLIASAMMFVQGVATFYTFRFLLGVVEAGFFPGMILYLTHWFPATYRAQSVARFMTAIPLAQVVGGPISGALLGMQGVGGLAGWQWLFLLEGLPSILLGGLVFYYMTERPEQAAWLPAEGKAWLAGQLGRERPATGSRPEFRPIVRDGMVWKLAALWLLQVLTAYGQLLWLPQIIKGASEMSDLAVGVLSVIPPLAAAITMVLVAAHSDRTGERHRHVAVPALVGGAGFVATAAVLHSPLLATAALTVVAIGLAGAYGPFWGLATAYVRGTTAAGGIALINSVGNLGGFAGPYVVGLVKDATGSFAGALVTFAGVTAAAALFALRLRPSR